MSIAYCFDKALNFPFLPESTEDTLRKPHDHSDYLIAYDGSIVNMGVKHPDGSVCYIIGVQKAIRKKLGKGDGDPIHVVIEA